MKKKNSLEKKLLSVLLCAVLTTAVFPGPAAAAAADDTSSRSGGFISLEKSKSNAEYISGDGKASETSWNFGRSVSGAVSQSISENSTGGFTLVKKKKSSKKVSKPEEIPEDELTGDPREDVVTIARSQLGYEETRKSGKQLSYFGTWVSKRQGETGAPWCSEFASWCIYKSGVPLELYPKCASVYDAREYQGSIGRIFAVEDGNKHSKSWIGEYYNGTIPISAIQPGDVLLVNRRHTGASDPTHTALVESVDEDEKVVHTIDGNVGSKPHSVKRREYTAKYIYAVVKPLYELSPLENVRAEYPPSHIGKAVRIAWETRMGVNGYIVYRSGSPDGEYAQVGEINDSAQGYFDDTDVTSGRNYYYKVVPYVETASGDLIDGMAYIDRDEETASGDEENSGTDSGDDGPALKNTGKTYVMGMTPVDYESSGSFTEEVTSTD